ncbi:DUF6440 family protein [Clostridium algoriphilum]|uniref:DUF6440 family protein n=1 Tax=Clostridium algoriphilum TaxID=198347 RepID=UPI001CF1C5BC|nr:DUF6440 family protein [Clostridium algoriphilum]MCB2296073.1 DUF6440 family protein [Clostridium algoriphilum]
MFNKINKNKNKLSKTVYDHDNNLAVRCKLIVDREAVTNYLISIEDCAEMITVLLDKDGNPMFSQVRL